MHSRCTRCTAAPRRVCPWRGCSTGCASASGYSGCAWRLWAARHSQKEAQPLPRVLELAAACKVAQFTAFSIQARINLRNCPFLARLLQDGETLEDLLKLTPEQILLRWINFHLKEAGSNRRVANFGHDLCDSEAYCILLKQAPLLPPPSP